MDIRLLGPVSAVQSGRPVALGPRRQRFILAVLALEVNRAVPVERLVELAWPVGPPRTAGHAIQVCVSRLRSAFAAVGVTGDEARIGTGAGSYILRADPEVVDVHRFRLKLREAAGLTDDERRIAVLTEALDLWTGPALTGAASEEIQERLGRGLEQARLTALEDRLEARLRLGRHQEVLGEAADLSQEYPTRERLAAVQMLALYRSGQAGPALAVYQEVRRHLAEVLGLDPGPELHQLELAILRNDPHLREAVPPRPRPVPRELPPDVRGFSVRQRELADLDEVLARAVPVAALSGTGGVGKTALAVHWAHRVADRFPDGQLYLNLRGYDPAGSPVGPAAAVRRFLDALGVPAEQIPATLEGQFARYRSELAGRRVLLVLDNARDAEQVRPLLPGTPGCLTVVTSRSQLTGLVATAGAHLLTLSLLTEPESAALLAARLGPGRAGAEPAAVEDIVAHCAGLPLALAIAAARAAAQPAFPLATLAGQLRDAAGALDALDGGDPATDVRTVFSWSYRTLRPPAAALFRRLGLHPGPDMTRPAAAALAGRPAAEVRPLLAELTAAHLLTEAVPGRYTSHDLLRAYATELTCRHDTAATRQAAVARLVDHYLYTALPAARRLEEHRDPIPVPPPDPAVVPEEVPDAQAWFVAEHATLIAVTELAAGSGLDARAGQLAWALSAYLHQSGHWAEELAVQRTALAAGRRSGDLAAQARAHHGIGAARALMGRYDEAYLHHRQALRLSTQRGDPVAQAQAHNSLAWVCEQRGQLTDTLYHAQCALDRYRDAGHRVGEALALNFVGWAYALLGDYRRALHLCQRALRRNEERGDRAGQAWTLDSLGYIHHHLGRYDRAITLYGRALDRFAELADRHTEAGTHDRLGDTYLAAGDPAAARRSFQRAADMLNQLGHPDEQRVRAKLAQLP